MRASSPQGNDPNLVKGWLYRYVGSLKIKYAPINVSLEYAENKILKSTITVCLKKVFDNVYE